jgi:hypothetical protein
VRGGKRKKKGVGVIWAKGRGGAMRACKVGENERSRGGKGSRERSSSPPPPPPSNLPLIPFHLPLPLPPSLQAFVEVGVPHVIAVRRNVRPSDPCPCPS